MPPRIAYLILAHDHPLQLRRLVRALDHDAVRFFVHIDAKAELESFTAALPDAGIRWLAQRQAVNWGGWSQTAAILSLMRAALEGPEVPSRLFLLSGACYPVASNTELLATADRETQWIGARAVDPALAGYDRIRRYHLNDHPLLNARGRSEPARPPLLERRRLRHYVRQFLEHLPDRPALPLRYHKGSTWWSLTHAAARYVIDYCDTHPAIVDTFRWSAHADESLVQTLIANSPFGVGRKPPFHYVDWSRQSILNKKVLDEAAIPRLQERHWFVRKVHPDHSATLLDTLDRMRASPAG